jgi:hypothetical protein
LAIFLAFFFFLAFLLFFAAFLAASSPSLTSASLESKFESDLDEESPELYVGTTQSFPSDFFNGLKLSS